MKLYAPEYYKNFKCIADKCRHSCCIGWEIDIDEKTADKYADLCGGYGENIKNSIDFENVPHFKLCENDRCPHLNEKGLCRIILHKGEDFLCDICREHPRFYHYTAQGKEVGIGMACEEASRLILSSDGFDTFVEVAHIDEDADEAESSFNALPLRNNIFGILADQSITLAEKMQKIATDYNVSPFNKSDEEWQSLLGSIEYLDEAHKSLFSAYSSTTPINKSHEKQLERAFAYFVFRHTSDAFDEDEFCASLGFAYVCVILIASVSLNHSDLDLTEIARIVSEELEYSEENTQAIKQEFLF